MTAATGVFAVLGDPVGQARVPKMLNPLFGSWDVDAVVVPLHVIAAEFAEVVTGLRRARNVRGLFVTVPHKVAAARLATRSSSRVLRAGCANVLRPGPDGGWYADNFDGLGFVAGLRAAGFDPAGKRASLAGAGGAGAGIAVALLDAGAAELHLYDTDERRSRELALRLGPVARVAGAARVAGTDLVVNATPLGLRAEDPLPFDPGAADPGTLIADIIMHPAETALLRAAAGCGCRVQPGEPMLAEQLPYYREFFGLGESASAL